MARLLPVLSRPNHRIAQTAQLTISRRQQIAILASIPLVAVMLLINLTETLVLVIGVVTAIYLVNCLIRMAFAGLSLQRNAMGFTKEELERARIDKPNALTRWQTASYHFHFRLLLPALDRLGLPVPLGGTSNFFRVEAIREIGGWDAWNVTEDLDLGIRLARRGWKVRMIDSTTWEEPNPLLGNCVRQWSRWKKGAMQTYLVHMRHPVLLWRDLGPGRFLSFQFTVGAPPLILLLNPILMVMSFLYWVVGAEWVSALFPTPVLYAGNFCLVAGNLFFIFAIATASLHRKQFGLVPTALFSIFHWILMIVAAYKAFWQLVTKRSHHWEVTQHGHAGTMLTPSVGFGSSVSDIGQSNAV